MDGITTIRKLANSQTEIDAIENPAFFLTFFRAPVLAGVALEQARRSGATETARWILVGLGAYAAMFVVTLAFHLPLNDNLMEAGDPSRIEDLAAVRDDFVTPWVTWNIVRTLASTVAFGSLAWALFLRGRTEGAHPRRSRPASDPTSFSQPPARH